MNDETTYNGWTNRATWLTALWLGNERSSYEYWRDKTREIWEEAEYSSAVTECNFTQRRAARCLLVKVLMEEVAEQAPTHEPTLFSDLLQSALDEIEWYEIAEEYLNDFAPEKEKGPAVPSQGGE